MPADQSESVVSNPASFALQTPTPCAIQRVPGDFRSNNISAGKNLVSPLVQPTSPDPQRAETRSQSAPPLSVLKTRPFGSIPTSVPASRGSVATTCISRGELRAV